VFINRLYLENVGFSLVCGTSWHCRWMSESGRQSVIT